MKYINPFMLWHEYVLENAAGKTTRRFFADGMLKSVVFNQNWSIWIQMSLKHRVASIFYLDNKSVLDWVIKPCPATLTQIGSIKKSIMRLPFRIWQFRYALWNVKQSFYVQKLQWIMFCQLTINQHGLRWLIGIEEAPNHYGPRYASQYGVTRLQWINYRSAGSFHEISLMISKNVIWSFKCYPKYFWQTACMLFCHHHCTCRRPNLEHMEAKWWTNMSLVYLWE